MKLGLFVFAFSLIAYWCPPLSYSGRTVDIARSNRLETAQDPDPADEKVYAGKDVDSKPIISSQPKAEYTPEARRQNVEGVVSLSAVFTSQGEVRGIKARKRLPAGLTESATAAAGKITFAPAMKDGHPVSIRMQLEYKFNPGMPVIHGQHFPKLYYDRKCRDYSNIAPNNMIFFESEEQAKNNGYKKSKVCP